MTDTASPQQRSYADLQPGDPAPWFYQRATSNPRYAFHAAAGRYVVLCFMISAAHPASAAALAAIRENRALFDDANICVFGVSNDPADESEQRLREDLPGIRHFWDFDGTAGRLYGATPQQGLSAGGQLHGRQLWIVLDPTMRVIANIPFAEAGAHAKLVAFLRALPPPARFAGFEVFAPVLVLPNIFEPALCERLITLYEKEGGTESGFMRDVDGKTVLLHDASHKKRKDCEISDPELVRLLQTRIRNRVAPEIQKVHAFQTTRMERYIVSCYAAEDGGHFRAHRDNTTAGTAHRRFAASINLNGEFEGGELNFPEYGPRTYRAPPGGAIVFSGALLHAVSPVTAGRRYAFLPFLYDEAAAKIREANAAAVEGQRYRA